MFQWLKGKTKLDRLKERYSHLMKRSFRIALHNKEESDRINREARKLYEQIKYLSLQEADK
ncbi:MAG: hypothetical protein CMC35_08520 [Flavobacteriaceae bacterium]|nr:hypothetical protein [Flavobacteriaceae bacterium]